jgi:hypothetical protein
MLRAWPTVSSIVVIGLATAAARSATCWRPRNRAQRLLGVRATHGRDLDLAIYAIETSLGAGRVLAGARALVRLSGIPRRRLVLVDRHDTYDHVDLLPAVPPRNAFVRTLVPFLRRAE